MSDSCSRLKGLVNLSAQKKPFLLQKSCQKFDQGIQTNWLAWSFFETFSEHGAAAVRKFLGCLLFEAFMWCVYKFPFTWRLWWLFCPPQFSVFLTNLSFHWKHPRIQCRHSIYYLCHDESGQGILIIDHLTVGFKAVYGYCFTYELQARQLYSEKRLKYTCLQLITWKCSDDSCLN